MSAQQPWGAREQAKAAETWACHIAETALEVPVTCFDDSSSNSMPDALIHLTTGAVPMEVVREWDADYSRLKVALRKRGQRIDADPTAQAWLVSLEHSASVSRVRSHIRDLIAEHEEDLRLLTCPEPLRAIGVASVLELEGEAGYIWLAPNGWSSWEDHRTFDQWLTGFFDRHRDVPAKLSAHGGAEQHAFIWIATPGAGRLSRCWSTTTIARTRCLKAIPRSRRASRTSRWQAPSSDRTEACSAGIAPMAGAGRSSHRSPGRTKTEPTTSAATTR